MARPQYQPAVDFSITAFWDQVLSINPIHNTTLRPRKRPLLTHLDVNTIQTLLYNHTSYHPHKDITQHASTSITTSARAPLPTPRPNASICTSRLACRHEQLTQPFSLLTHLRVPTSWPRHPSLNLQPSHHPTATTTNTIVSHSLRPDLVVRLRPHSIKGPFNQIGRAHV